LSQSDSTILNSSPGFSIGLEEKYTFRDIQISGETDSNGSEKTARTENSTSEVGSLVEIEYSHAFPCGIYQRVREDEASKRTSKFSNEMQRRLI
jgi:hypothetical protein